MTISLLYCVDASRSLQLIDEIVLTLLLLLAALIVLLLDFRFLLTNRWTDLTLQVCLNGFENGQCLLRVRQHMQTVFDDVVD